MTLRDHFTKKTDTNTDKEDNTGTKGQDTPKPSMFDLGRARAEALKTKATDTTTAQTPSATSHGGTEAAEAAEVEPIPQAEPSQSLQQRATSAADTVDAASTPEPIDETRTEPDDDEDDTATPSEAANAGEWEDTSVNDIRKGLAETTSYTDAAGKKRKLTQEQLDFCELVVQGMNLSQAYEQSHNCVQLSQTSINEAASRLNGKAYVQARIRWVREREGKKKHYSAQRVESEIIEKLMALMGTAEKDSDKLKAIELLGKMKQFRLWDNTKEVTVKDDPNAMKPSDFRAKLAEFAERQR